MVCGNPNFTVLNDKYVSSLKLKPRPFCEQHFSRTKLDLLVTWTTQEESRNGVNQNLDVHSSVGMIP
jgi:hypothetical protein